MERPQTVAVAGAGAFGREHLRTLAGMDGVAIAGVADAVLETARRAVADFDAGLAYSDPVDMIEQLRPDAVVIATPGHTHVDLARAALRLGVPVLLEKPVGLSAADADLLIEAEAASTAFVLPGHILRFSPPYRAVADIARSGELGLILSVSARNHRDDGHALRYAEIDPVLMTMVHDLDMAQWITGAELACVFALRRPSDSARSETLVTATDARGCMWHISNAWTYPTLQTPADRLEVVCERGSIEMEYGAFIRVHGSAPREIDLRSDLMDDMLLAELSYFLDCVTSGSKPELVTLQDARGGLAAADAILESLRREALVRR